MAVGMIGLLLTAVLALISLSVKNSRLSKDRTMAVGLAQQGVELMRTYRDYLDWSTFLVKAGTSYDLPENWTVVTGLSNGCPATKNIYDYYLRCVVLTAQPEGEVAVQVTVSWAEGSQTYQTVQSSNLSLWER